MPQDMSAQWLAVIGRSLALICLKQAEKDNPNKMASITAKVNFLKGLGLPQNDAAEAVGSSPASVAVLLSRTKAKKKAKGNGAKKKSRR